MFGKKELDLTILTDERLHVLMTRGNDRAFNVLYNRYKSKMLYYFYRMLGNDEAIAQDFLQELFFKIIDKPHLFDSTRKFSTWIYSVAHNMCKNEYRGRAVRKIIVKNPNIDVPCENNSNKGAEEKVLEAIFKELENLDESHRTAFLLKYREELSIEEIAEILDLPAGTVKSRLFYTRKRLNEILTFKYAGTIEDLF